MPYRGVGEPVVLAPVERDWGDDGGGVILWRAVGPRRLVVVAVVAAVVVMMEAACRETESINRLG